MSTEALRRAVPGLVLLLAGLPAAAVEFEPEVGLSGMWNGNTQVTGEEGTSDTALRAGMLLPWRWRGPRGTSQLSYRLYGDLYRGDGTNELGHELLGEYERSVSRRSTLTGYLGGSRSEQQGILTPGLPGTPGVSPPAGVDTFLPSTPVTRLFAGLSGEVGTGPRSFLAWGVDGRWDDFGDLPDLDLVDSTLIRVDGGWGWNVSGAFRVQGVVEATRVRLEDAEPADVFSAYAEGRRTLVRRLQGRLSLGASRVDASPTETVTEPRFEGDLARQLSPASSLVLTLSQQIGGSNGLTSSPTLEKRASFGWTWHPPRGLGATVTLSWSGQEPILEGATGGAESLETREALTWLTRSRFGLGLAHTWRKQDPLDASEDLLRTDYHAFEFFTQWYPLGRRGREEAGGGH